MASIKNQTWTCVNIRNQLYEAIFDKDGALIINHDSNTTCHDFVGVTFIENKNKNDDYKIVYESKPYTVTVFRDSSYAKKYLTSFYLTDERIDMETNNFYVIKQSELNSKNVIKEITDHNFNLRIYGGAYNKIKELLAKLLTLPEINKSNELLNSEDFDKLAMFLAEFLDMLADDDYEIQVNEGIRQYFLSDLGKAIKEINCRTRNEISLRNSTLAIRALYELIDFRYKYDN